MTDVDMVNKDQREAWLEGALRIALVDMKYIRDAKDMHTANGRMGACIRHLELTIEKIDAADAARRQHWEDRRLAALKIAQQPLNERRLRSSRFLPTVMPSRGEDPPPLFLQK